MAIKQDYGTKTATGPGSREGVGTDTLADLTGTFAQGRTAMAATAGDVATPALRRFSTLEVTRSMIRVAVPHFRRVLKANPALPQGTTTTGGETGGEPGGGTRWFTLAEVQRIRAFFAAEGSRTKSYLPWRPEGVPAKIVALANTARGSGKTTTAAHLAMAAAMDGYRVLVIDLDGQGDITGLLGGGVADQWGSVFPLLARHHARHMQDENRVRAARGDPPQPLDDTLARALTGETGDLVVPTRWSGIDLIGAGPDLLRAEMQIADWRLAGRGWRFWDALADSLRQDGTLARYDIVILDTPPALGHLTVTGLAAADILLVPMAASRSEFDATGRFLAMLHATFAAIEEAQNMAARALGGAQMRFCWDALRSVITRYDAASQADIAAQMQVHLGAALSPQRQDFSALLDSGSAARADPRDRVRAVYEADPRRFGRDACLRSRDSFDAGYVAFRRLLHEVWAQDARTRTGTEPGTRPGETGGQTTPRR